ncbi:hypothetical protein ES703_28838 [subsurface metagenome]
MAALRLKWSSLLNLTELDFEPEPPKVLKVSDELLQTISWLTGATKHDRRLLRCDENGALLIADAWSLLNQLATDELYPDTRTPDSTGALAVNKGVLIATSTQIVKISFVRVSGGDAEHIYIPADCLYWYPHPTYSVTATIVPEPGGTASYIGITTFI